MHPQPLSRILMVEDNPDILEIARFTLESIGGFTVETCSGGLQALAEAPGFAPDLILLDVMMPDLDGISTLRAMRQIPELASVPVVFMTAKVQNHEVSQYRAMGALAVIAKPFNPMTLPDTIKNIWAQ